MKLIREEIEQVEVIVESRNGKKNLFIEGVFLQGEIKNQLFAKAGTRVDAVKPAVSNAMLGYEIETEEDEASVGELDNAEETEEEE